MSHPEVAAERERLLARIAQAGTARELADARARLANLEAHTLRMREAAKQMGHAVRAAEAARDRPLLARLTYSYGRLQHTIEERGEATHAFLRARDLYRAEGDVQGELMAWHQLVRVAEAGSDVEGAWRELSALLDRLHEVGSDRGLYDSYRHRAALNQARLDIGAALSDYEEALAAATRLGEPERVLQVRIERRSLHGISRVPPEEWEDWSVLAEDAARIGDTFHAGDIQLQRAADAMRDLRHREGLVFAEQARKTAQQENREILYLMSCLLIAEGREKLGDDAGVIEVLLTCMNSLEKAFGPGHGKPVLAVLNGLETKWGKPRLVRARLRYRSEIDADLASRTDGDTSPPERRYGP